MRSFKIFFFFYKDVALSDSSCSSSSAPSRQHSSNSWMSWGSIRVTGEIIMRVCLALVNREEKCMSPVSLQWAGAVLTCPSGPGRRDADRVQRRGRCPPIHSSDLQIFAPAARHQVGGKQGLLHREANQSSSQHADLSFFQTNKSYGLDLFSTLLSIIILSCVHLHQ